MWLWHPGGHRIQIAPIEQLMMAPAQLAKVGRIVIEFILVNVGHIERAMATTDKQPFTSPNLFLDFVGPFVA